MSLDVNNRILNIEYSRLPGAAGNSLLHFQLAAEAGFDGLKADMRLSKDGEIVLCHDSGYTFDQEGRITVFNASDCVQIRDLNLNEILRLKFDTPDPNGDHYGPCTLESMLRICVQYDLIPYLTNRHEDWCEETAAGMAHLLRKYGLADHCIMNLYSGCSRTMNAIRKFLPDPVACDTKHDYDLFSREMIDASAQEGYRIICLCHRSKAPVTEELIRYAASKNISVWEWGMTEPADVQKYLDTGITGFQMYTREITNTVIRGMGY